MNITDIAEKLINAGLSSNKSHAKDTVNEVLSQVTQALSAGNEVKLAKFGTFKPVNKAPRSFTNPQTGEKGMTKASTGIKFTAAAALKEAVNN